MASRRSSLLTDDSLGLLDNVGGAVRTEFGALCGEMQRLRAENGRLRQAASRSPDAARRLESPDSPWTPRHGPTTLHTERERDAVASAAVGPWLAGQRRSASAATTATDASPIQRLMRREMQAASLENPPLPVTPLHGRDNDRHGDAGPSRHLPRWGAVHREVSPLATADEGGMWDSPEAHAEASHVSWPLASGYMPPLHFLPAVFLRECGAVVNTIDRYAALYHSSRGASAAEQRIIREAAERSRRVVAVLHYEHLEEALAECRAQLQDRDQLVEALQEQAAVVADRATAVLHEDESVSEHYRARLHHERDRRRRAEEGAGRDRDGWRRRCEAAERRLHEERQEWADRSARLEAAHREAAVAAEVATARCQMLQEQWDRFERLQQQMQLQQQQLQQQHLQQQRSQSVAPPTISPPPAARKGGAEAGTPSAPATAPHDTPTVQRPPHSAPSAALPSPSLQETMHRQFQHLPAVVRTGSDPYRALAQPSAAPTVDSQPPSVTSPATPALPAAPPPQDDAHSWSPSPAVSHRSAPQPRRHVHGVASLEEPLPARLLAPYYQFEEGVRLIEGALRRPDQQAFEADQGDHTGLNDELQYALWRSRQ